MAAAGLKLFPHGATLSVTNVTVFDATVPVYSDVDLTTEATLPITLGGIDGTVYVNVDGNQMATVTATQPDGTTITRTVLASARGVANVDLRPSDDSVYTDVARIDTSISTAVATAVAAYQPIELVEVARTDSHTLTTSDIGKILSFSSESALTLSLPALGIDAGATAKVVQLGTASVVFAADGTASVVALDSKDRTAGQYAVADLWQQAEGTWLVSGALTVSGE